MTGGEERELARAHLGNVLRLQQSAEARVLTEETHLIAALRTAQHTVFGSARERTHLQRGRSIVTATTLHIGHGGTCPHDKARLLHVGDIGHQTEVAAITYGRELSLEVLERGSHVAAHILSTDGQRALALERAVDLAARRADDGVGSAFLHGDHMVEGWHRRGAVHVDLIDLATSQYHRTAHLAEGSVPSALCHRALLHDKACEAVGAAIGEVDAPGTVLH